jgi:hypothetical protein
MAWFTLFLWLQFLTADWSVSTEMAPGYAPETDEQRSERVALIDAAIAVEAFESAKTSPLDARTLAAATKTKWHGESRFAHAVHAGDPGRYGSDEGRSRCLGQIQASGLVQPVEWRELAGLDEESTRRCARATMRVLSAMARYCQTTDLAVVFSAYGTGRGCAVTNSGRQRAARARALLARL